MAELVDLEAWGGGEWATKRQRRSLHRMGFPYWIVALATFEQARILIEIGCQCKAIAASADEKQADEFVDI